MKNTELDYFLEANINHIKTIHIYRGHIVKKKWFDKRIEKVDVFGIFVRRYRSGYYAIDDFDNPLYQDDIKYYEYVGHDGKVYSKPMVSFKMVGDELAENTIVFETNEDAENYFDKYVKMMHNEKIGI